MSLSHALNLASNGLTTTQAMSRVTAGNVSNAMTPGYVRREAVIATSGGGEGSAVIAEIQREVDTALVRMSRQENAKMVKHQAVHAGLKDYTIFLGQPGDGASTADKFSAFNTSLTTLANMPSSTGAQTGVVYAAEELATSIRGASNALATVRAEVDMEIRYEVADLNQHLHDVAALNQRMQRFSQGTMEQVSLEDDISRTLDAMSGIVDLTTTRTVDGWINVYTTGGVALLEGDSVRDVTYNPGDGSIFAGTQEITPGKDGIHGLEEGSLAGFIELKNETLPLFQLQLDEYARALIQTFEAADSTVGAGQPGLFTDNGLAFNASRLEGLAGRLQVNSAVRPSAGGDVWRIRDGVGATTEGAASDSTQVHQFIDALDTTISTDNDSGLTSSLSLSRFASEILTIQSSERTRAEDRYQASASAAELIQSSRQSVEGVNIDEEMQKLLLIEQSFSANSKMLTTVAEMLDTLLAAV